MAFIFYLSSQEAFPQPRLLSATVLAILVHLMLYSILSLLILFAVCGRRRPTRKDAMIAILGSIIYAISDEVHQSFVPGRHASMFDVFVDGVGAVLAISCVLWWSSTFRRWRPA